MQTTINDKFKYISIAMDDDCLSEEVLDKLLADKEASQKWYEYHLIGDCLRSRKEGMGKDFDFAQSSNFMATLAEISLENKRLYEAGQIKPVKDLPVQASNHAFKGFAIAASVAAFPYGSFCRRPSRPMLLPLQWNSSVRHAPKWWK